MSNVWIACSFWNECVPNFKCSASLRGSLWPQQSANHINVYGIFIWMHFVFNLRGHWENVNFINWIKTQSKLPNLNCLIQGESGCFWNLFALNIIANRSSGDSQPEKVKNWPISISLAIGFGERERSLERAAHLEKMACLNICSAR